MPAMKQIIEIAKTRTKSSDVIALLNAKNPTHGVEGRASGTPAISRVVDGPLGSSSTDSGGQSKRVYPETGENSGDSDTGTEMTEISET